MIIKKNPKSSDSILIREWLYLKKTALLRHYLGDIKTQGAHPANGQSKSQSGHLAMVQKDAESKRRLIKKMLIQKDAESKSFQIKKLPNQKDAESKSY